MQQNKKLTKFPLIMVGIFQLLLIVFLAYSASGVLSSGLGVVFLLWTFMVLFAGLTVVAAGYYFKHANYFKPFQLATSSTILSLVGLYAAYRYVLGGGLNFILVMPFIGITAYLLGFYFITKTSRYLLWISLILLGCIGVFKLAFEPMLTARWDQKVQQARVERGFKLFAPDKSYFKDDNIYLAFEENDIAHAITRIDTPNGRIDIFEAPANNVVLSRLLTLPDRCDSSAIYDNIMSTSSTIVMPGQTSIQCTIIYNENNRIVMRDDTKDNVNDLPYVAKIGDTLLIFRANNSTGGEFSGELEEGEGKILEFVKSAREITDKELGLE